MQAFNYWEKFAGTGKVEDYLSYAEHRKACGKTETEQAGENPYAGIHMCDRNDIETGAYWRI